MGLSPGGWWLSLPSRPSALIGPVSETLQVCLPWFVPGGRFPHRRGRVTSRTAPRERPCPRPGWQRVSACGDRGTSAQVQLSHPDEPGALLPWESVRALMRTRRQQTAPFCSCFTEARPPAAEAKIPRAWCDGGRQTQCHCSDRGRGKPPPGSRFSCGIRYLDETG